MIPSKTFLLKLRWDKLFENNKDAYYSLGDCIKENQQRGTPIKMIVDLTNTENYYSFDLCRKKYFKEELKDV